MPPPPPGGSSRSRRGSGSALRILVIVAVLAGGAVLLLRNRSEDPAGWDERVVDLVSFVESERGHRFERPVTINFLDADAYRETMTGIDAIDDPDEPDEDEDRWLETLRALGFIHGDLDSDEMNDTLLDIGTLAAYDPATKEIHLRGTELTPALRVTLVHELTHALQDQHFDLEGRLGAAADDDDERPAVSTLRDIVEGDASRIEERYVESLGPSERAEIEETRAAEFAEAEPILDEAVPSLVQALFQAPYLYGTALVMIAEIEDGNDAVDRLFRDPPSEFALFNPMNVDAGTHPAADQEILEVPLPDGAEAVDDGSFAPLTWYLMLATALEPEQAMAITDDIVADGYRSHVGADGLCITAHADTSAPDALLAGLRTWASAVDGRDARVEQNDDLVVLTTCDPGPDGPDLPETDIGVMALPAIRTFSYGGALAAGIPEEAARCFGEGIAAATDLDDLASGGATEDADALDAIFRRCAT